MQHVIFISMMCVYIESFSVSVIAPHAGMVFYGILFGGMQHNIYIHDVMFISKNSLYRLLLQMLE